MSSEVSEIRRHAYALWEREGRPDGRHLAHWGEAERQAAESRREAWLDEGLKETFPASDPPTALRR